MKHPIVDLHCHMLPGIDDGPDDMDEALAMARMAVDNGITHAVVTPHLHPGRWENTLSVALPVFTQYAQAVVDAKIPLKLGLACEARLDPDLLLHLEHSELPFLGALNGKRVMLLELPHGQIPLGADRFVEKLVSMNIRPIIAHPERNKEAMRRHSKLEVFEELGCLFQITAGSLLGKFGSAAEQLAIELLDSPSTFLIASDAHNTHVRIPELLSARDVAASVIGAEAAMALVSDNPWRLAQVHFAVKPKRVEPRASKPVIAKAAKVARAAQVATSATVVTAASVAVTDEPVPAPTAMPKKRITAGLRPHAKEAPLEDDANNPADLPLDVLDRIRFIRRLATHLPPAALERLADELRVLSQSKSKPQ